MPAIQKISCAFFINSGRAACFEAVRALDIDMKIENPRFESALNPVKKNRANRSISSDIQEFYRAVYL